MITRWRISVLFFVLMLFAFSVNAGALRTGKIVHLQFYTGHHGILFRQADMVDPDNCGRSDLYILPQEHPFFKEIYTLLLAAHMDGKPVAVYLEGCVDGVPALRHVYSDRP